MGRVMQARNSRKYFSDVVIFFSIMLSAFLKNVEPLQFGFGSITLRVVDVIRTIIVYG